MWTRFLISMLSLIFLAGCEGMELPETEIVSSVPSVQPAATNITVGSMVQPTILQLPSPGLDKSSIVIVVDPPAKILVTDPRAKQTGFDPAANTDIQDIPLSTCFHEMIQGHDGQCANQHQIMEIQRPVSGKYRVLLSSSKPGLRTLSMSICDSLGNSYETRFHPVFSQECGSWAYALDFDKTPNAKSQIRPE